MSLDSIINMVTPQGGDGFVLSEGNINNHIKVAFHYVPDSTVLYVLLPPWKTRISFTSTIARKLAQSGCSFLAYEFPGGILSSDAEATKSHFETIVRKVIKDVQGYAAKYGFTSLRMMAVSLGCVHASMVVSGYPKFNEITLVIPGHCLAESLWHGIRTRHLRKEFAAQGITLEKLKSIWSGLAPENNLGGMGGARINVLLSMSDQVIPYRFGSQLVRRMREAGLVPQVKENRFLGHYGTAVLFYKVLNPVSFEQA